ncbi:MAG: hypothetical protein LBP33_04345 [Candidatus Adiutrix sp.]|jgi:hypothetical protein|nr:hypothetical protein [Candidatus Adiutrix sp.]
MADILANLTQVINNSPQLGSLLGGQMAADEVARRQARIDEARRQEEVLRGTVLAPEASALVDEPDPDGQGRGETRRQRLERLKLERERCLAAARAARARRAQKRRPGGSEKARAESPDQNPVVDVRV